MKAVVIGAGLGGLAAAMRLDGSGWDVTVLEGSDMPGGRAGQIRDGGYTWDTGPSLITMPELIDETFAAGGRDAHEALTLRRLDPFYRIRWAGDDRRLDFTADRDRMVAEIARFNSHDARAYDGFMERLAPIYDRVIVEAGGKAFGVGDLARLAPEMVRRRALGSLWARVAREFRDPRIREAFSFHSLFIGGDPFRVPALYGALVYLQVLGGVWYADGGVHALVRAMAGGLDVRLNSRVQRVEHRGGRVSGVVLEDGSSLRADVVVYNGDILRSHELLGRPAPRRPLRTSMSCFLIYLGCDREHPELLHHTLLVGRGYRRFIGDVTRRGRIASTVSSYVHAPARTEPGMAPPGGDALAVLVPVPNLRSGIDWEAEGDALRDRILDDMEHEHGISGLRASVRVEHRWTPEDFRRRLGAVDGNAFSLEPTLQQSACFRPSNRDPSVGGMYYVGAGTHPGAGIPGVLLGARVTAGLVAQDHGSPGSAHAPRRVRRAAHA